MDLQDQQIIHDSHVAFDSRRPHEGQMRSIHEAARRVAITSRSIDDRNESNCQGPSLLEKGRIGEVTPGIFEHESVTADGQDDSTPDTDIRESHEGTADEMHTERLVLADNIEGCRVFGLFQVWKDVSADGIGGSRLLSLDRTRTESSKDSLMTDWTWSRDTWQDAKTETSFVEMQVPKELDKRRKTSE